ncbi:MAG TPA: prolyl oligopeptidase family serine peptidase [Gemmatimonadaceae bacterium]|nr:prolyl oligopeptidase family serine peptidase [Gemmatimonadaceae bacterium]
MSSRSLVARVVVLLAAVNAATGAQTDAPVYGHVSFENSGAPAAQPAFLRGMALLHNFQYPEAAAAFREAERIDPRFAMAYWGEAMTYNHGVWHEQDSVSGRGVLSRLGPDASARLSAAPTQRERDYLATLDVLYGTDGTKFSRDSAYAVASARLAASYPRDDDAQLFYALSLLSLPRVDSTYMHAAQIAERIMRAHPDHPGALHYVIHAYDDPAHATRGLQAARAYSKVAVNAPHAQHMVSHIFIALGMWDDVVKANEIAVHMHSSPAEALAAECGHGGLWLHYGYLEQGRQADAARMMNDCREHAGDSPAIARGFAEMRLRQIIDGAAAAAQLPTLPDSLAMAPFPRFMLAYGDAYDALQHRDTAAARSYIDRMVAARTVIQNAPARPNTAQVLGFTGAAIDEMRGIVQIYSGDRDGGIATIRAAAEREEALPFLFGPPEVEKPTRELLGELLLALHRPAEARTEFQRALARTPERSLALLGLARSNLVASDSAAPRDAYRRLANNWHRADATTPALDEARHGGPAARAGAAQHASSDVGVIRFPNSGSAAAQAPFLRAIAQLHNFEYREAQSAFHDAERADPTFALPYWFEALSHSPVLWSIDDAPGARAVLARLGPTPEARLAKAQTSRERAFGAAIEAFYEDSSLTARSRVFMDSMSALAQRDTSDLEASAFAALATLMYNLPTNPMSPAERDAVGRRAIAFGERVYHASPRHPGGAHYLIHAADAYPSYTARALQPAFDYAYIAPASEHAQHMPAHTFFRLGLWDDANAANERAWKASVAEGAREHRAATDLDYHNFTWLQYVYLQQGRWHAARALVDSARRMIAPYDSGSTFTVDAHYVPTFLEFGYANETGRWTDGPRGALATAPLGPAMELQRERRQMGATNWEKTIGALMRGDTSGMATASNISDATLQGMEIRALIAERRGDRDTALDWWRKAARVDTLNGAGPPRYLVARDHLAALLMATGHPSEAVAEYERSLITAQNRSAALLGLARAKLASGDTIGSAMAYRRLLDNWKHADADLPALAEARAGADRAKETRVAMTRAAITKQRVWFKNGSLMLEGFLFKPTGNGPFPAVLWNHGSEHTPGAGTQFDSIGGAFVPRGYVVFAPSRRGHDESDGEHIALVRGRVAATQGQKAGDDLVTRLLTTEQLSDQLAALTYMKSLPFVDTTRMVVAGCSFGGIQTLLAAEGSHGFKAAVPLSPAAQNWDHNDALKARLLSGVARINIPVLLIQPPRDASLAPSKDLGAAFTRLHKAYRGIVWPDTLSARDAGHCFGGPNGTHVWAGEAVTFFDTVLAKAASRR